MGTVLFFVLACLSAFLLARFAQFSKVFTPRSSQTISKLSDGPAENCFRLVIVLPRSACCCLKQTVNDPNYLPNHRNPAGVHHSVSTRLRILEPERWCMGNYNPGAFGFFTKRDRQTNKQTETDRQTETQTEAQRQRAVRYPPRASEIWI